MAEGTLPSPRSSQANEDVKAPLSVRMRPYLIALPALLVLIGILYPFVIGVYYSMTAYTLNRPGSQNVFVGLRNYWRMITDPDFLYGTYITLAYAVVTTGIELGLGLLVAMLLNREFAPGPHPDTPSNLSDGDCAGHRHPHLEDDDAAQRRHSEPHAECCRVALAAVGSRAGNGAYVGCSCGYLDVYAFRRADP